MIEKAHGEVPFTMIPNETLRDSSISPGPHFLLCWILSYPEGWRVTCNGLATETGKSRATIQNWMNELIAAGYVERMVLRKEGGTFDSFDHLVHTTKAKILTLDTHQGQDSGIGTGEGTKANLSINGKAGPNKEGKSNKEGIKRKRVPSVYASLADIHLYSHSSWPYEYAEAFALGLESCEMITEPPEEKELQAWADTFRLLHTSRGYTTEEIRVVCEWLLQPDNWWIVKGNIYSARKLTRTHDKNDCIFFETFRRQYRSGYRETRRRAPEAAVGRAVRIAERIAHGGPPSPG